MNGLWIFIGIILLLLLVLSGNWGALLLIFAVIFAIFGLAHFFSEREKSISGYKEKARVTHEHGIPGLKYGDVDIVVYEDRIVFDGIQILSLSRVQRIETSKDKVRVKLRGPYSYGQYGDRYFYSMRLCYLDKDGKENSARFTSWEWSVYGQMISVMQYVNAHIDYVPSPIEKNQPYEI